MLQTLRERVGFDAFREGQEPVVRALLDGRPALNGDETVTTTYEAADQPYAAIAAQQDGEERAAAELSRMIRLDLAQALNQGPAGR